MKLPTFLVTQVCVLCAAGAVATPVEDVVVIAKKPPLKTSLVSGAVLRTIELDAQVSLNRTVADMLERLPGVSLNGQGGLLQSYSVRGFSRWRVMTLVDGVPLITDRRAGNAASFVPPELLSQVQVAPGPLNLYGSGGMGGAVRLSSINPDTVHASIEAQDNDQNLGATFGYRLGEDVGAAVSLRRANRAQDAEGETLNTEYEQAALLLKLKRHIQGKQIKLTWLPSYGQDIGKSNAEFPATSISEYPEESHSLLSLQVSSEATWTARLYHHYQDWQSRTEQIDVRTNRTDYRSHSLGGVAYAVTNYLHGTGRVGVEWTGRRGVSIRETEFTPQGDTVRRSEPINGSQDNLAAFIEHQWQRADLEYGAALRYDHAELEDTDRTRSEQALNGNFRLGWQASQHWKLTGSVGTGFRFPSMSELYFIGTTPRGDTLGNPELEAEQSITAELGAALDAEALTASLNVYQNRLQDYIELYRIDENLRSFRNLNRAEIWGFEAQIGFQQNDAFSHLVSYQWQRGEDNQGNWLADLNPPALRYLLDWHSTRFHLQSDLMYRAARNNRGEGEQSLDSALIWNLRLNRRLSRYWAGEVFANNLLNEHYLGSADDNAAFQPGRIVGVRLRWERSG